MTAAAPAPVRTIDVSGTQPVPFSRLVAVEWRKTYDTRGGFWLLLVTGLLILLTMGLTLLVVGLEDLQVSAWTLTSMVMVIPVSILVPVFAIVAVTSEWSQRSGLVTFALEPNRMRVVSAKLVVAVLLGLASIALAMLLGALAAVICSAMNGFDVEWGYQTREVVMLVVQQVIYFVMAFGIGMVVLSTPGAITLFYVIAMLLPFMVYGVLYALFTWAQDLIPWIDLSYAMAPLSTSRDAMGQPVEVELIDWARAAVAVLLWVVAPLVIGTLRIRRSEVK